MANIDPELLTSTLWDSDSDSVGENDIPSSYPNQVMHPEVRGNPNQV